MPATGHPQTTQTTAAHTTWRRLPLRTALAAQVSMYMAKLLGSRLVAEVNMPLESSSRSSKKLLQGTLTWSLVALHGSQF